MTRCDLKEPSVCFIYPHVIVFIQQLYVKQDDLVWPDARLPSRLQTVTNDRLSPESLLRHLTKLISLIWTWSEDEGSPDVFSVCRHAAALKTNRTFSARLKMNVRVWRVDEPRRRLKRDKNIWNRSRRESRDKRIKQVTDHHHLHHPRFYLPMCYEFMDKGQVWTTAAHSQLVRNVRLRQPMELNPSVQINVWNQNQRL